MTALQESTACQDHLISSITPTWIKDAFFSSHISWQGSTLPCLAAVLYLFHVFLTVGSRLPAHSHHCTVFSVKLYVLSSCNSPLKIFSQRSRTSTFLLFHLPQEWPQPADRTRSGSDGLWTAPEPEGSRQILLLPHAAACTGRDRKKEIRRENASCRSLSLVRPDIFSCLSNCN